MDTRWKNAVGVVIILIISATIIAGAVVSAVGNNKNNVGTELFIDEASFKDSYKADGNVIYVKHFHDAIANYFKPISSQLHLDAFADQVVEACYSARIPAYKLEKTAQVLNRYSVTEIGKAIGNNSAITEEQMDILFAKENPAFVAEVLHAIFAETGLTGEEFGNFVYQYLAKNSSEEYQTAIKTVGKEKYVEFVGATAYFLSQMKDYSENEGRLTDAHAFSAAAYQLGSIFIKMGTSASPDIVEKALGFRWSFDDSLENYSDLVLKLADLKSKFSSALLLIGEILRATNADTIGSIKTSKSDAEYILARISLAKDLKKGFDNYILKYAQGTSMEELRATYSLAIDDIYYATFYVSGGDVNASSFIDVINETNSHYSAFFDSLIYLNGLDLSKEDIDGMSEEEKNTLLLRAQELYGLSSDATLLTQSIIYLWSSSMLRGLSKEG